MTELNQYYNEMISEAEHIPFEELSLGEQLKLHDTLAFSLWGLGKAAEATKVAVDEWAAHYSKFDKAVKK